MEVDVCFKVKGYTSTSKNVYTIPTIKVKKENEISDFTGWSALFAPTGFRMVGFFAMGLTAEKLGEQTTSGLGVPENRGDFEATWDEDERTLYLDTPNTPRRFDAEAMTNKIKEYGIL
jgi:hypothetical protein